MYYIIFYKIIDRALNEIIGYRLFLYKKKGKRRNRRNDILLRIKDYDEIPEKKDLLELINLENKKYYIKLNKIKIYPEKKIILLDSNFKKLDIDYSKINKRGEPVDEEEIEWKEKQKIKYGDKRAEELIETGQIKEQEKDNKTYEQKKMQKKYGYERMKELLNYGSSLDIVKFINKTFPNTEFHTIDQGDDGRIRKASFCGPGTQLNKRLENYNPEKRSYTRIITPGINRMDRACMEHDLDYGKYKDKKNRLESDKRLIKVADEVLKDNKSTFTQKTNARLIKSALSAKVKFGLGINPNIICKDMLKKTCCSKCNQIERL